MGTTDMLKLVVGLTSSLLFIILVLVLVLIFYRNRRAKQEKDDTEISGDKEGVHEKQSEDLLTFHGGHDLTIADILEAPGEVIGKSNYGTLYKALLPRNNSVTLLRFLRPVCTAKVNEFEDVIQLLGFIRHPNLVPLLGFYGGPRGEKLLVHPFCRRGNLAQFIRDGNGESHNWTNIYKISIGIAKGLDHLHSGLQKPIIHGNLKSKNIFLDRNCQPYISDFGIYMLLNPAAAQEMLESSAAQGYKAPELIKMKDVCEESDIYSLGLILLELLSGREPINENPTTPEEDFYLPTYLRNSVLDHRITDLYHPNILQNNEGNGVGECRVNVEQILLFFQLGMSCCSPSPSLRPKIKQVLWKLEEIGKSKVGNLVED